jgi:hypothetical protein
MPHDGTLPAPLMNGKVQKARPPTSPALDLSRFDFTKPLVWDATGDWATEFNALVKHPPLHSVVIEIAPEVADQLLKLSNTRNRPKLDNHVAKIGSDLSSDNYELTGDTIKFSKKGTLLDGQHRLAGAVKDKTAIISHFVFGLDDEIFDVIDQGKKRTPADVLALCGISEATMVAGAIAWVLKFEAGVSMEGGAMAGRRAITPRKIRELALGKMKDVTNYSKDARLVNTAYKHPPTMVCGMLYLIGRHDPALARDFAHEWVHGAKIGRNKNFDILNQRLNSIAHVNNGIVNRDVRAALLIVAFNHWHAHIIASPRALTWRRGWTFPTFEFNPERFKEAKQVQARENTSLPAVKYRVHYVLTGMKNDKNGEVSLPLEKISELANVSKSSVGYILGELVKGKQISKLRDGKNGSPATYRVDVAAADVSEVET